MIWLALASAAPVDRDLQAFDLEQLTSFESRNIHHPGHDRATAYLRARLHQIPALLVTEESFTADGVTATNLIGILPGSAPELDPVVISAHYDSTGALGDDYDPMTSPAPGADDDASGCAAVLEVARQLSMEPGFQRSIEFILFDAEEEGLLGSLHHVEQRTKGVHAMVTLDPVGLDGTAQGWMFASVGEGAEHIQQAYASALTTVSLDAVTEVNFIEASLVGVPRSDHGPFLAAGYPAMHLSTFPPPPGYHTADDTLDVIDPDFLADATGLTASAVRTLAEPTPPKRGCSTAPSAPSLWGLFRRR